MKRACALLLLTAVASLVLQPASAVHFYRGNGAGGTGSGCSPSDGALSGDTGPSGPSGATIKLGHNAYDDGSDFKAVTGFSNQPPTTTIDVGESVTWTWNSSHCHSVTSGSLFNSGLIYPTSPPESPKVVPGFFEYPVLDSTPTLSYTRTFMTTGTYTYFCMHHASIGMTGTIVVQ